MVRVLSLMEVLMHALVTSDSRREGIGKLIHIFFLFVLYILAAEDNLYSTLEIEELKDTLITFSFKYIQMNLLQFIFLQLLLLLHSPTHPIPHP